MIDETFLQSATRIRRTYLKMSNNMTFYQKSASEVVKKLDNTLERIEQIKEEADKNSAETSLNSLMKILQEIEDEGKRLEDLVNPLNKEIEKLALEEQELYRQIKEKHHDLTDEQIVESVKERLIKENLS